MLVFPQPAGALLLNLHEISSVHVLRYSCDYSRCSACLHIEDYHLANDLAGQQRSTALDFGCGNWPALENTSCCFSGSSCIYGESPATELPSLKATFPSGSHLFILHVNDVADANVAVDC